jgi:ABC-2 type transport system permease protein
MLWYKSWLDTRWRFLIGLALMMCAAFYVVAAWTRVKELLPTLSSLYDGGELSRRIRDAAELQKTYAGFVWSQWFRQTPTQTGTLFAILLGSGGLLSHDSSGRLFTLSLPVSREWLVNARAVTGLAEWFAIAIVPALLIPLLSPTVGERYAVSAALVHGICIFVGGAVFFSLAVLLSTVFDDLWRPLLIAVALAVVGGAIELAIAGPTRFGTFCVMTGENYFRTGLVPWSGLAVNAAIAAAMLYGARLNLARRDF